MSVSLDEAAHAPHNVSASAATLDAHPATSKMTGQKDTHDVLPVFGHADVAPLDDELPPLPVDDDESFFYPEADNSKLDSDGSAIMDREMRRKLMDIESSFLPDPAPAEHGGEGQVGVDDTYLFGGSPGNNVASRKQQAKKEEQIRKKASGHLPTIIASDANDSETPEGAYKTPAPWAHDIHDSNEIEAEESSQTESMVPPSSPAAAAAERVTRRAASGTSARTRDIEDSSELPISFDTSEVKHSSSPSLEPVNRIASRKVTIDDPQDSERFGSEYDQDVNDDSQIGSGDSSLQATVSPRQAMKRSSFQRSRPSYHRNSMSSTTNKSEISDNALSDATVGADYALQTGGARPAAASTSSGHGSIRLSRMASLGSIASSISAFTEGTSGAHRTISGTMYNDRGLGKVEERRESSVSPPATPRADSAAGVAPTDTVIANHVQNIRVPDTVAKAFREKHLPLHETRFQLGASGASGRSSRNNLTLKEQNSKIDKLSKENFDLKLKIHFLDQALQNRSDEGVKDMISKNVQLQTDLANEKKENQSLRKKVRELERAMKLKEEGNDGRPTSSGSEDNKSNHSAIHAEMEEEILYLREVLHEYESQIEKLKEDSMTKEVEKRRMAEYVKTMGERKAPDSAGVEEATEMWKDLLEAEQARREQADEDAAKLREEVQRLRAEASGLPQGSSNNNMRNYYHITKRHQLSYTTRSHSGSEATDDRSGAITAASSTLVEQLRHENAELRRDLGAQTSMLTSRNRERERLQQEIEDLKITQRRANGVGSVAGDSIFERSISRAHIRSASRASGHTRASQISDGEREEYERKQAALRDEVAQTKMLNQDLERELNAHLDILSQTEADFQAIKTERDELLEDLQTIQAERDEALLGAQDKEAELEKLHDDAVGTVDELENLLEQKEQEIARVLSDLENRNEDFAALQQEMKTVSAAVIQLEDDRLMNQRKIEELEREIEEANQELEAMEEQLSDAKGKNERLDVQIESHQGEISFLREEQEGDKIRIGDLEAALAGAQSALQDEKERIREMEEGWAEEKTQREALEDQEKAEVQKMLDELNHQLTKTKDEVRKLRKSLSSKEVEATNWKDRLQTLESGLREALGDLNGTRTNLFKDVIDLQATLETTLQSLDSTRSELAEKDRLLRSRDTLLESTSLEVRRVTEVLEKERQARRADRVHYDQIQRGQQSTTRLIQSHDKHIQDLEAARSSDRKRHVQSERQLNEHLTERNNLLLALWNRLSTICGSEWAQQNSLVDGKVPSLEVVATNLPSFTKNLVLAAKTVEGLIGGFRGRIRNVEKDLWRDFQNLEHKLDVRTRQLEKLERHIRADGTTRSVGSGGLSRSSSVAGSDTELRRLRSENKRLKTEVHFTRAGGQPLSPIPMSPPQGMKENEGRDVSPSSIRAKRLSIGSTLLRHHSEGFVEGSGNYFDAQDENLPSESRPQSIATLHTPSAYRPVEPTRSQSEHRDPQQPSASWMYRLKLLQKEMKAEREARSIDRSGARMRLVEGMAQNKELKAQIAREKDRRGSEEYNLGG